VRPPSFLKPSAKIKSGVVCQIHAALLCPVAKAVLQPSSFKPDSHRSQRAFPLVLSLSSVFFISDRRRRFEEFANQQCRAADCFLSSAAAETRFKVLLIFCYLATTRCKLFCFKTRLFYCWRRVFSRKSAKIGEIIQNSISVVGQTFQSTGARGFPTPCSTFQRTALNLFCCLGSVPKRNRRLESRLYWQVGKPALRGITCSAR
jgi:hypothetical protein